jgi:Bacterial PH domain
MSEYSHEPIRGLPGVLPEDETILWQSSPNWQSLVKAALHVRLAAAYFGAIVFWAMLRGDTGTALGVSLLGSAALGLFVLYAWGVSRTSVYTLTNKRIVLRVGVALNKCINVPLSQIETANLKMLDSGRGNIVLSLKGAPRLGYLMLWPHARSLRIVSPQPMLRAIPEAQAVAQLLLKAAQKMQAVAPQAVQPTRPRDMPIRGVPA